MKHYQYDEATRVTRRMTLNALLTIIIICALSFGSIAIPLQTGQAFVMRLTAGFALALASQHR